MRGEGEGRREVVVGEGECRRERGNLGSFVLKGDSGSPAERSRIKRSKSMDIHRLLQRRSRREQGELALSTDPYSNRNEYVSNWCNREAFFSDNMYSEEVEEATRPLQPPGKQSFYSLYFPGETPLASLRSGLGDGQEEVYIDMATNNTSSKATGYKSHFN